MCLYVPQHWELRPLLFFDVPICRIDLEDENASSVTPQDF